MSAGTEIALGIERVGALEALFDVADIVSLHCPLTAETKGMIGAEAFRRMKPNAILINTARGEIVDVSALIAAIRAGEIAGAGIDVLPTEPPNRHRRDRSRLSRSQSCGDRRPPHLDAPRRLVEP